MEHQAFARLLGNYGEFLGSVAVLATLVYLAIQTRQNKVLLEENQRHIRAQKYQMRTDAAREVWQLAITVPELREYMVARDAGREPTPAQQVVFRIQLWISFRHAENLYYQYRLSVLDEGALSGVWELAESIANSPINKHSWEERKHVHPRDFVAWMDDKIAALREQSA